MAKKTEPLYAWRAYTSAVTGEELATLHIGKPTGRPICYLEVRDIADGPYGNSDVPDRPRCHHCKRAVLKLAGKRR